MAAGAPFDLNDKATYQRWRTAKLANYPSAIAELKVRVRDPYQLTEQEKNAIINRCSVANMAIYELDANAKADKETIRALGAQLGLNRLDHNLCADEDAITSLRVISDTRQGEYIPYTNRRLNWHTDGYYNQPHQRIRAFITHCVVPSASGGENGLLDHEIVYLLMRDEEPEYISALMQPDAMTIPANVVDGLELRPARTGPVFSVDPRSGTLHMNYTARVRNIEWKQDDATQSAIAFIGELLSEESPYIFKYRLRAGEGIVCNNVLHCRAAFIDGVAPRSQRLLYRARYYDRIVATDLSYSVEAF